MYIINTYTAACTVPVNGEWTEWGSISTCSLTCGPGVASWSRTCTNPEPQFGGDQCAGQSTHTTNYNLGPCPINGEWTIWTISSCTVTCGHGTRTKSRTCTNPPPQYGGDGCAGSNLGSTY
eukprot:Awhi_evm1s5697